MFEAPSFEVVEFETTDIVTVSPERPNCRNELPEE